MGKKSILNKINMYIHLSTKFTDHLYDCYYYEDMNFSFDDLKGY